MPCPLPLLALGAPPHPPTHAAPAPRPAPCNPCCAARRPTYPIFSFANGARVNPTNYNKTVFDFGSTSRPFCAFRPALALDNFDSVPGVVDIKNKVRRTFEVEQGKRNGLHVY